MQKLIIMFLAALIGIFCVNCENASASGLSDIKQIGFRHIELPYNVRNEEVTIKSLYFTLKEEAEELDKVTLNYDPTQTEGDDAHIVVYLRQYELTPYWNAPHVKMHSKELWSDEYEWTDEKGKKRKRTVTRYETEPYGVAGKYTYTAHVTADFTLVSAKTGEILFVHSASASDDKEMDAYKELVKEFYKKLNKKMKKSDD